MNTFVLFGISSVVGIILYATYKYLEMNGSEMNDDNGKVITLFDNDFYYITKNGLWLVMFYSPKSVTCKMMTMVTNDLVNELNDEILVAQINTTKNTTIVSDYFITTVPTLILFKNGKMVKKWTRFKSKELIINDIKILYTNELFL
jgi:thioredoxin 1